MNDRQQKNIDSKTTSFNHFIVNKKTLVNMTLTNVNSLCSEDKRLKT